MYLADLKEKLASLLSVSAADFVYPLQSDLGDLSLPLFNAAKLAGKSPALLAQEKLEILTAATDLNDQLSSFKVIGPYLNFFLSPGALLAGVIQDTVSTGADFGRNNQGQDQRLMLEYSNANTHKEYHIGHLRNLFYGDAVTKILNFNGYQTLAVSYINDFGIHVAKTLWEFRSGRQSDLFQAEAKDADKRGYVLGNCYVEASKELTEFPEKKEEVSKIMKAIESRQGDIYALWQETRAWSIAYFAEIYQRLGIKFSHIFYESEVIADGLKITADFLTRGVFKKSQGAIIADLEEYDLGVLPIIRSDGTALYPVADLALARLKFKDYQLDESIYVVDIRQGLYFKQLAKIFALAGENLKITHLGYDFVTLKNGMMSSRSGNVITYNQIWDEAFSRAKQEVVSRHDDWSQEKITLISGKLVLAALKFEMLKVSADKVITFDIDEALRFEGFTAAYLQYTGARLASILRKAPVSTSKNIVDYSLLVNSKEVSLALLLHRFTETVARAGEQRDASALARYLFDLAQAFNDYYHEVPILKTEAALAQARLELLRAVKQVLSNGFTLLGFDYLEEM